MIGRKNVVIVSIVVALVGIAGVFAIVLCSSPSAILGACYSRTSGVWRDFVIVARNSGYNDSKPACGDERSEE